MLVPCGALCLQFPVQSTYGVEHPAFDLAKPCGERLTQLAWNMASMLVIHHGEDGVQNILW
jgi:hypothetical protein